MTLEDPMAKQKQANIDRAVTSAKHSKSEQLIKTVGKRNKLTVRKLYDMPLEDFVYTYLGEESVRTHNLFLGAVADGKVFVGEFIRKPGRLIKSDAANVSRIFAVFGVDLNDKKKLDNWEPPEVKLKDGVPEIRKNPEDRKPAATKKVPAKKAPAKKGKRKVNEVSAEDQALLTEDVDVNGAALPVVGKLADRTLELMAEINAIEAARTNLYKELHSLQHSQLPEAMMAANTASFTTAAGFVLELHKDRISAALGKKGVDKALAYKIMKKIDKTVNRIFNEDVAASVKKDPKVARAAVKALKELGLTAEVKKFIPAPTYNAWVKEMFNDEEHPERREMILASAEQLGATIETLVTVKPPAESKKKRV